MYLDKLRIRIKNEFWEHFLQAVKHLYLTYDIGRIDANGIDPVWYISDLDCTYRKCFELKGLCWIPDLA